MILQRGAAALLGMAVAFALTATALAPEGESRAAVIVDTGGTVKRRCIRFSAETISGKDALDLADAQPVYRTYTGQGVAVCALCGVGCPADSSCLTCGGSNYWAYSRAPAGSSGFTMSGAGAGSTRVGHGDVEGWRWGPGVAPEFGPFEQVCLEAAATTSSSAESETTTSTEPSTSTSTEAPRQQTEPTSPSTEPRETSTTRATSTTRTASATRAPSTTTGTGAATPSTARQPVSSASGGARSAIVFGAVLLALCGLYAAVAVRRRSGATRASR